MGGLVCRLASARSYDPTGFACSRVCARLRARARRVCACVRVACVRVCASRVCVCARPPVPALACAPARARARARACPPLANAIAPHGIVSQMVEKIGDPFVSEVV